MQMKYTHTSLPKFKVSVISLADSIQIHTNHISLNNLKSLLALSHGPHQQIDFAQLTRRC